MMTSEKEEKFPCCSVTQDQSSLYLCGSCRQSFPAICQLHLHLKEHVLGGSYHYDHLSHTAFPKYDMVCNSTQTILASLSSNFTTSGTQWLGFNINRVTHNEDKVADSDCDKESKDKDTIPDSWVHADEINKNHFNSNYNTTFDILNAVENSHIISVVDQEILDKEENKGDKIECQLIDHVGSDSQEMNLEVEIGKKVKLSTVKLFCCRQKDCFKEFRTRNDLRLHTAEHSGKKLFKCDVCEKQFVHKPSLRVHLRLHERNQSSMQHEKHFNEKSKRAEYQSASSESKMIVAEQGSTNVKEAQCDICQTSFSSKSSLNSHKKSHRDTKSFVCTKCPKKFTSKQGLIFHTNVHEGKKFECDVCGKQYGHEHTLKKHKVQHTLDTQFKCDHCGRYFAIRSLYNKHMASHTREKCFTCEICGFQTHCKNSITTHRSTHGENQFECSKCDKTFSRKAALLEHMHTHSGIKPYVCEYCAMAFTYQSALVTHRRIHTGQRPYKCETCSRTFSLRHIYKRHLLTHTHEKPYKCRMCDKAFTQEYNRAVHMRQHTGEKPFKCDICTHAFAQRCSLKSHMRSHYDNL